MEACVTSYGDGMKRTDSSLVIIRHESICCKSWKRLHILSLFALTWTAVSIATFSLWQCIELKEQNAQISVQLQQMKSHFSEENALRHHESMNHLPEGGRHRQHQARTPAVSNTISHDLCIFKSFALPPPEFVNVSSCELSVFRRKDANRFKSKPFYTGVFEVTANKSVLLF